MMPKVIKGVPTRDPTGAEARVFRRCQKLLRDMRPRVECLIAAGSAMGYAEEFRRSYGLEGGIGVPPFLTNADAARIARIVERANLAERAVAGLETGMFGLRLTPDGDDCDVYDLRSGDVQGLGVIPLIPLIVVGIVLVVGALAAYITSVVQESIEVEADLRRRKMELDSQMAKQPADVRQAYGEFQKTDPYAKEKSIWDSLKEGIGNAAGIGLLVLLGMLAFREFSKSRRSSPPPEPSPVLVNPDTGEGYHVDILIGERPSHDYLTVNPCPDGGGPPGYVVAPGKGGWRGGVYWSDRGQAVRDRQAAHIQDWIDGEAVRGYAAWSAEQEEVPF